VEDIATDFPETDITHLKPKQKEIDAVKKAQSKLKADEKKLKEIYLAGKKLIPVVWISTNNMHLKVATRASVTTDALWLSLTHYLIKFNLITEVKDTILTKKTTEVIKKSPKNIGKKLIANCECK
jgi:hypothetical protein